MWYFSIKRNTGKRDINLLRIAHEVARLSSLKFYNKTLSEKEASKYIVLRLMLNAVEYYDDIMIKLDAKRMKYKIDDYIHQMIVMEFVDIDIRRLQILRMLIGD